MAPPRAPNRSAHARSSNNKCLAEIPARRPCCWVTDLCEGWLDTLSVAGYRLRHKGPRCDAVIALRFERNDRGNKSAPWISVRASIMTNSLHFSEWRNCIRAQRKVNLCAPGAPKGPKVGTFVHQYEIVCANDAGRAPRKYPGVTKWHLGTAVMSVSSG